MEEGGKIVGTALANTREHTGMVSRVTLAGDFRVVGGRRGWWCGEKQLKLHRGGRWWWTARFLYRKREEKRREDVWGTERTKASLVDEDERERRCWNQYVAHSLASCSSSAHHLSFLPSLARGETFVTC